MHSFLAQRLLQSPLPWVLGLLFATPWVALAGEAALPALVPAPAELQLQEGRFVPGPQPQVSLSAPHDRELRELGELAASILKESWDVPVSLRPGAAHAALTLALQPDKTA